MDRPCPWKASGSLWSNSLLRKVAEALAMTSRLIVESGIGDFPAVAPEING